MVLNPWGRGVEESYDFDVTKSDKLFDFLLEKGQIKLPDNHVMLPPNQLKNKKFCKFHNAISHSTNECRVFRQHIQRAIQQGRLKFDTPRKMKVDDNPFPGDQNMVDARLLKGRLRSWHQPNQEKLEQSILRCKYRLTNTEKLKDVMTRKRADMSREKRQKKGRRNCELYLEFCWINGSDRRKRIKRWLKEQAYQHQLKEERYEREHAELH